MSHLARKREDVLFWGQYMDVFKSLNYKDIVIPVKDIEYFQIYLAQLDQES